MPDVAALKNHLSHRAGAGAVDEAEAEGSVCYN